MSRNAAKRTFTVDDLAQQTEGVECRKDPGVVDEIPGAYKNIERGHGAPGRPGRGGRPAQAGAVRQRLILTVVSMAI